MENINVAIIGVGNCASALIQGIEKYKDATNKDSIPGLMHPVLGKYGISNIKVVAAFDVDSNVLKVNILIHDCTSWGPQEMAKQKYIKARDIENGVLHGRTWRRKVLKCGTVRKKLAEFYAHSRCRGVE